MFIAKIIISFLVITAKHGYMIHRLNHIESLGNKYKPNFNRSLIELISFYLIYVLSLAILILPEYNIGYAFIFSIITLFISTLVSHNIVYKKLGVIMLFTSPAILTAFNFICLIALGGKDA